MKKQLLPLLGIALLLGGCAKEVQLPSPSLHTSCHRAPLPLQLHDIRSVEVNELGITLQEAQHALLHAMSESRCFTFDALQGSYATELLYSSKIIQEKQKRNLFTSEYRTLLVVEATLVLRDSQSFSQHQGIATLELKNREILWIGDVPEVGDKERRQTLELAIKGALQEAMKRR